MTQCSLFHKIIFDHILPQFAVSKVKCSNNAHCFLCTRQSRGIQNSLWALFLLTVLAMAVCAPFFGQEKSNFQYFSRKIIFRSLLTSSNEAVPPPHQEVGASRLPAWLSFTSKPLPTHVDLIFSSP